MKYFFLLFFVSQQAFSYSKEIYMGLLEEAKKASDSHDYFTACKMSKEIYSMALSDGIQPEKFKKMADIACKYYEMASAAESNDLNRACTLSKELKTIYFDEETARKNSDLSESVCREYENQSNKQGEIINDNSNNYDDIKEIKKIDAKNDYSLPIKYAIDNDGIQIYNSGECPLYKVEIRTYSPNKEGFKGIVNLINSRVIGLDNFTKNIGTIERNQSISVQRHEFINMKGERLSSNYMVGTWHVSGSYCGENRSINIAGD